MANYAVLKAAIEDVIKTNGNNEITGELLQESLIAMINSLGAEYQFAGVATVATNPGTPDHNVFYIAGDGLYSNFGATNVPKGCLGIFMYNGDWTYNVIDIANYTLVNVNDLINQSTPFASAGSARTAIPPQNRKAGLNITYLLSTGEDVSMWVTEQYIGDDVEDWTDADKWQAFSSVSVINQIVKNLSAEIIDYPTKECYMNPDTGKFGSGGVHAAIPVTAGEKYVIEQYAEAENQVSYAFATTDTAVAGESVPVVTGTEITRIPALQSVIVEIPQGCNYLLVAVGDLWNSKIYNYLKKDSEPKENSTALSVSGGIPLYMSRKNPYTLPLKDLPLFKWAINSAEQPNFSRTGKHSIIPINPNDKIWIKIYGGSATIGVIFAMVKSYSNPQYGDALDLCTGTTVYSIGNNGNQYLVAPEDAKYLVVNRMHGTDRTYLYTHLMINDINIVKGDVNSVNDNLGVKRYTGTTSTGYSYRLQVDIKSGSIVHNIGTGTVRLYDVYDGTNYISLAAGEIKVMTFDITQVRGYSSTDLPFDLIVYPDKDVIIDSNGIMLKDDIKSIISNMAGEQQTVTISTNYTFAKLPFTILKGSIIKSVTSTGGRTSVGGARTTNDTSESALTLTAGTVVTKDINYIRYTADTYTITVLSLNDVVQDFSAQMSIIYNEKTFNQSFTSQYQQLSAVFPMQKGMVVKSILLNGAESKIYGRTTNTTDSEVEAPLIIMAGTILTKDINYLRNINTASSENPAEYTVVLYTPYTYVDGRISEAVSKVSANTVTDDSISNGDEIALADYPKSLRRGDHIIFNAKITSFSKLKIGKGCDTSYLNSWFEIDDTNVKLYHYTSTTSGGSAILIGTEAHGLTIAEMLNVNIIYDGSITIKMQSSDGYFEHEFTAANDPDPDTALKNYYNSTNGVIKAISVGSILTNVSLSVSNPFFRAPIWLFGASYTAIYANQMCGQLKKMGYFDYLSNGYPGCISSAAFTALQQALTLGTPQVLIWSIMSNDTEYSTWESYANQVAQICDSRHIILIFVNYPDMRLKEFADRRQWVISHGYRYVDLVNAVESSAYVYDTDFWYPGFMSSDGIHPTQLGASAMAMQLLRDIPEIMQL